MHKLIILIATVSVLGIGCGNDGDVGDALDLDIGPGEVRAGRLSASQLPADENGLAVYEQGDFALVNEHIALIVEDVGVSELYAPFGGLIVGIARYRDGALVDRADYNEFAIGLRRFLVAADDVSIVNDGRDGSPAVVRAEGPLIAFPFLEDLLGGTVAGTLLLGTSPPDEELQAIRAQVDYELAPGAEHIDIYYTLDGNLTVAPVHLFFQSKRMAPYVPGQGFGVGDINLEYPYMGWVDDDAVSYAAEAPSGPMTALFAAASSFGFTNPEVSGVLPLAGENIAFAAGERAHLMRIHIGGNGLEGLRQAIARTDGSSTRTITGTVRNADGSPAEGVRVHAETAGTEPSYLTRVISAADGTYALDVPGGQEVQLRAFRRGDGITARLAVGATTETADLQLPAKGTIRVVARDAVSQEPLPVRVQVLPAAEGFQPPENFGETRVPFDEVLHVVFPSDGDVTLAAPLGINQVVVSRGYEYDIVNTEVNLTPVDPEAEVNANLSQVVDSTGVMCGDFHIHTHRSPDAPDSPEFKLRSAAGDGVELPVRTDHEFVAAFEPVVQTTGLGKWLYGLSSLELTTFSWGHFGVFPLEPDASLPNDGAIMWNGVDEAGMVEILAPVPVFNEARSRPGNPEVIIFHPRERPGSGGGFDSISGGAYFMGIGTLAGIPVANTGGVDYDPATDTIRRTDIDRATWWDTEFKAVEVFNDSSFEENRRNPERIHGGGDFSDVLGTVDDWFGLLNSSERDGVFAVGSSDSHSIMSGSPVGYPRTCLFLDEDDPQSLRADPNTPQRIKNLVRAGRAVINGGIYITASASSGEGPGQTVVGPGPYTINITVQAPIWVRNVELIEMWVSTAGDVTNTPIAINPDPMLDNGAVLRYSQPVPVPSGTDWVIFHARGAYDPTIENRAAQPQTLEPVHPGRLPFGVTNPIFFEP
jgi:hypothetical protein